MQPIMELDSDGRVAEDIACRRCGYNLRTQPAHGVCPDCGQAVRDALQGYYLRYAPLQWLRRLSLGLVLIYGTAIIGFLLGLASSLLSDLQAGGAVQVSVTTGTNVVSMLIYAIGVWLFTTPEPGVSPRPRSIVVARVALLLSGVLALIGAACGFVVAMSLIDDTAILSSLFTGMIVTGWIAVVAGLVCSLAILYRIRHVMERVPRPGLARFAGFGIWLLAIVASLSFAVLVVRLVPLLTALGPAISAQTSTGIATVGGTVVSTSTQPAAPVATAPAVPVPGPTTAPAGGLARPARVPTFGLALAAIFGCGIVILGLAGLILLIRAQRAIAAVIHEQQARGAPTGS